VRKDRGGYSRQFGGLCVDGFRKFILRGNVVDLAVGVVIGVAFGAIVTTLVTGIINPIVGLAGKQNFDKLAICLKGSCSIDPKTGVASGHLLLYGTFVTAVVNFLIIAAVIYFFVVKPLQKLMDRSKTEPEVASTTKDCPECLSSIPLAAARCAFCTVEQLDVLPAQTGP
jgi:large conductance mechanosensitive channel